VAYGKLVLLSVANTRISMNLMRIRMDIVFFMCISKDRDE